MFGTSCVRKLSDNTLTFKYHNMTMEDLKDDDSVLDGVSFMKASLRWMEQQKINDFKHDYESASKHSGKNTCLVFQWDNDDLVMDNANVARQRFKGVNDPLPHFAFHTLLGQKMGWIQKNTQDVWVLGPNLQMIYHLNKVPVKGLADFRDSKGNPLYFQTLTDRNQQTYFYLSIRVSWKFTNLNMAFRSVVKEPTRSLHVYSDVGGSSIVGNRMTDLLREIKFHQEGRGIVYFEPLHIQYVPVRNQVLEMIEVQIAETVGEGEDLVKFKPGHSIVTLHFKKVK